MSVGGCSRTITSDLFPHRSNEMLRAEFYYNINTDQEEAELLSLEGKGDGS